jgi:hypothetical protein
MSNAQPEQLDFKVDAHPSWIFVFARPHNNNRLEFAVTADGEDFQTAWLRAWTAAVAEVASRFISPDMSDPLDPSHLAAKGGIPGVFDPKHADQAVCVIDIRGHDWYGDTILPTPSQHLAGIDLVPSPNPDPWTNERLFNVEVNGRTLGVAKYEPTTRAWSITSIAAKYSEDADTGGAAFTADVVRMWAANIMSRESTTWHRRWMEHIDLTTATQQS